MRGGIVALLIPPHHQLCDLSGISDNGMTYNTQVLTQGCLSCSYSLPRYIEPSRGGKRRIFHPALGIQVMEQLHKSPRSSW